MRSINNKINPGKLNKFEGVVIGDEHKGSDLEKTELVCSWCNQSLVRLSDKNNQSESWFCRNCSIGFDSKDEKIRHKQRLSIPTEDVEPAITSVQTNVEDEVEIRHTPPIRGTFAELQKRGLRIKDYHTTERQ